jgi:uncharacterized protein
LDLTRINRAWQFLFVYRNCLDFFLMEPYFARMNNRYIKDAIKRDLPKKIVLISGPRQVGKTTLAKSISSNYGYLNYDNPTHRKALIERSWRRDVDLAIFDELHKLPGWKAWLKGIYDVEGTQPNILVTGSARLDIARKMGDSLAGRHFLFRLHPFDLKELNGTDDPQKLLTRIMSVGGFPEPFFSTEEEFPGRWRRSHIDVIMRQDLLDLEQVRQITLLETLIELLRDRVGTPISAQALSEDLSVNDTTIRRWLTILESLFVVFKVAPWHRNIGRALKKAAKYYFFDNGLVNGGVGPAYENAVACALLKEVHYQQDVYGRELELRYLRNRDGDEIDFAVIEKKRLTLMLEAKWTDNRASSGFGKLLPQKEPLPECIHLVGQKTQEKDLPFGVKIRNAAKFLADLKL